MLFLCGLFKLTELIYCVVVLNFGHFLIHSVAYVVKIIDIEYSSNNMDHMSYQLRVLKTTK